MERISDLILAAAARDAAAPALGHDGAELSYGELAGAVETCARALLESGLRRGERVAVYLEKRFETVVSMFAAAQGGGAFVPLNPVLKARQVSYILRDCNVRILITSAMRLEGLVAALSECRDLRTVVVIDGNDGALPEIPGVSVVPWAVFLAAGAASAHKPHRVVESDMTAILYTSGSTGMPKGVILSHRNMLTGALSVSSYLENTSNDRILSVLPLSFDAGFSQLTTAFAVGARVALMNYLLAKDVIAAVARERITGLAGIPPLWIQLSQYAWPEDAVNSLRYLTNTGGAMPKATLDILRGNLPRTQAYLMYGLTEAFRSTFLPPSEVDRRPDSIGKAVPNAEILVVREDGSLCEPGEPGELVHRGPFVAKGYWNDPEKTAERFRPAPGQNPAVTVPEIAVWSGDTVRMDEEGFLYFVGRRDEMIKTSGYRVSPTEVEEVVYASRLAGEAVALGLPHPALGQGIVIVATAPEGKELNVDGIIAVCRRELPAYMVPLQVVERDTVPRNANGKMDRKSLASELEGLFKDRDG